MRKNITVVGNKAFKTIAKAFYNLVDLLFIDAKVAVKVDLTEG